MGVFALTLPRSEVGVTAFTEQSAQSLIGQTPRLDGVFVRIFHAELDANGDLQIYIWAPGNLDLNADTIEGLSISMDKKKKRWWRR